MAADAVVERYHRARPSYPAALFDDLVTLAYLAPGARVLEIGCGTRQATVPLAERGFRIKSAPLRSASTSDALVRFAFPS